VCFKAKSGGSAVTDLKTATRLASPFLTTLQALASVIEMAMPFIAMHEPALGTQAGVSQISALLPDE
jgi:hypothetical protein